MSIAAGGMLAGTGAITLSGGITNAGTLAALGVMQVIQGTLTNTGTLSAANTSAYLFTNNATVTNLSAGTLSGGTYTATGEAAGGGFATIDFARSGVDTTISTLDATVELRFINSQVQGRTAGGIAAPGALRLLDGRGWNSPGALTVAGVLELGGGDFAATGGLTITSGATLSGHGTIAAPLALSGTLAVAGGTMELSGGLTGTGAIGVAAGSVLRLATGTYANPIEGPGTIRAGSGTVTLTAPLAGRPTMQVAPGATLDLTDAGAASLVFTGAGGRIALSGDFTGVIGGLQTGDVLQLKDIQTTSAAVAPRGADSDLILTTAGGSVTLRFSGDYTVRGFSVSSSPANGTEIQVGGTSFALESARWASPALTWSFATANFAGSTATFSSFVDPVAQAALATMWRDAFARWAAVSGLTFVEVADTPTAENQPNIRVGWGDFGDPPPAEIGQASYTFNPATGRLENGAIVRLQDPAVTALVDAAGTLVYENTVSSALAVMVHEIGHALGIDHADPAIDPSALMGPTATAANRVLDISDIAAIRALYSDVVPLQPGTISIAALSANRPEGDAGTTTFTFTLTRDGGSAGAASVAYAVSGTGLSAADAADFAGGVFPAGTVSFADGQSSATLTIPVAGDAMPENDESFLVTLSNPAGAAIGTGTAAGGIQADDQTRFAVDPGVAVIEGATGAVTPMVFTITRDTTGLGAVTMGYAVETPDGTRRPANAADFVGGVLPSGTVSFGAEALSATVTINIAGDDIAEASEDFLLSLTTALPAVSLVSATATILADEPIADLAPVLGAAGPVVPTYYTGPVAGLEKELLLITPENLSIAVAGPNWFIHSGSGDDAIAAASGTNVLDGGTGSNFLTGGSGADTFFIDARGATLPTWSTITGYNSGDAITF